MKKHWLKFVRTWRIENDGTDIQKFDVPSALSTIIQKEQFTDAIKAGFKCCGLYPFDPEAINYVKCVKQTTLHFTMNECAEYEIEIIQNQKSLQFFEENIDKEILQQFKNHKSEETDWNGDVGYLALFNTWNKMYDDVYNKNENVNDSSDLNETVNSNMENLNISMKGNLNNNAIANDVVFGAPIQEQMQVDDSILIELVDMELESLREKCLDQVNTQAEEIPLTSEIYIQKSSALSVSDNGTNENDPMIMEVLINGSELFNEKNSDQANMPIIMQAVLSFLTQRTQIKIP